MTPTVWFVSLMASVFLPSSADIWAPVQVRRQIVDLPAGKFRAKRFRAYPGGQNPTFLQLLGVQYGEHPVGPLRWQPPKPFVPEAGVVMNATRFGPDCYQGPPMTKYDAIGYDRMSEGCLYLNVWAPQPKKNVSRAKLPVMFWIHGGSFDMGGSSVYDGTGVMSLRREIVLVTANYRLGALGFLGGDAISRSTHDGSAGNFGLQDTRLALLWVQRNIAALGGDPSLVTIFGQSAGSSLVACHLVAPKSARLFAGAIMESGAFDNYTVQPNVSEHFREFARRTGCNGTSDQQLSCMRSMPLNKSTDLHRAIAFGNNNAFFSPVVDGIELTATPEVLAAAGRFNPVKGVLLGTTEHEGRYMMPYTLPVDGAPFSTEAQYRAWVEAQFPRDVADMAIAKYPVESAGLRSWWMTAAKVYTDVQYTCPTQRSARWLAASGKVPPEHVFLYEYRYQPSSYLETATEEYQYLWCYGLSYCTAAETPMGAGHASEVDLLWGDLYYMNSTDFIVSKLLNDWWINFATALDPNSGGPFQAWAPYAATNTSMIISPDPKAMVGNRQEFCPFWDSVHPVPYTDRSLPAPPSHVVRPPSHVVPVPPGDEVEGDEAEGVAGSDADSDNADYELLV